jgi:hypothetical protein
MRTVSLVLSASLILAVAACANESELELACDREPALTKNAMSHNALTSNALTSNGWSNGVRLNGVRLNGVRLNGVRLNGVRLNGADLSCEGHEIQFFQYLVGCALRADQTATLHVDDHAYTFEGAMGLAPEWADGDCGESCQQWVSSCLIARSNARGERVEISLRGDHASLATTRFEEAAFPAAEARYYGNLFADEPVVAACLLPGNDELERVCGELAECPVDLMGSCDDLCDGTGCADVAGNRFAHAIAVYRDAL